MILEIPLISTTYWKRRNSSHHILSQLHKASGPNIIPYRILFLLKMKFQSTWQICSTSLSWLVFFLLYSKLQVVPVFKKDSKLDYSNYLPVSLLSNIEKILKTLCIRDCIPFLIRIILSITYSLDSDNSIPHLMP